MESWQKENARTVKRKSVSIAIRVFMFGIKGFGLVVLPESFNNLVSKFTNSWIGIKRLNELFCAYSLNGAQSKHKVHLVSQGSDFFILSLT
jgi:hypothetical protein